jgi:hypothetical protein
MSGNIIDQESVIFTVPDPALIGPSIDSVDIRQGKFQILDVTGTFTTVTINSTTINVTNANIANLSVATLTVANLGSNAITPTSVGSGVLIDGVLIRDRPHYQVPNRSVACFESANPASVAGISIALVPYFTGALIGSFPDGTAVGGNTRGNYSVDWQLARTTATQVAASNYCVIGGGAGNVIADNADYSTTSGGLSNAINTTGAFIATSSFIGGGGANTINATTANATYGVICGGQSNSINNAYSAAICGAQAGVITGNNAAFIGGGYNNRILAVGDNCVISGGGNNIISGTVYKSVISGGDTNQINNGSNSTIVGGISNTISAGAAVAGGASNTVSGDYGIAFGYANTIAGGSSQSITIGTSNYAANLYSVAFGYGALSYAYMSHTFSATDSSSFYRTNNYPRSHLFADDIFQIWATSREIHNENTIYYYGNIYTKGPHNQLPFIYIYLEPYSCHSMFIHITGGGGNDGKTANGQGWCRCYTDNANNAQGTGIFFGSANEDSGFGFGFDVVYSGSYAVFRISCGVGASTYCNWTAVVRDVKATKIFGI